MVVLQGFWACVRRGKKKRGATLKHACKSIGDVRDAAAMGVDDDKQALVLRVTIATQLATVLVFVLLFCAFLFCCGGWDEYVEPWLQDISQPDDVAGVPARKQDTSGLLAQFIAGREKVPQPETGQAKSKKNKKKQ